jgi:hypothetical protein
MRISDQTNSSGCGRYQKIAQTCGTAGIGACGCQVGDAQRFRCAARSQHQQQQHTVVKDMNLVRFKRKVTVIKGYPI